MPDFLYTVKNEDGKTITGTLTATSKEAVVENLQQQNYYILSIQEGVSRSTPKRSKQKIKRPKKFSHEKVTTQDKLAFATQLATMLDSGVNLLRSLSIIVKQVESKKFYNALNQIYNDVEQGISFSNALAKHPKIFDTLWVSLVEVGEASGTMPRVLNKIASYAEKAEAAKSGVISAMIYPAILLTVAIGAITIFALFIGPKFENMFKSMGAELPGLTQTMLDIFSFMRSYFFHILGVIIVVVFLIKKYIKTPLGRIQFEKLLFKIPILNEMIKLSIMEKFASQMAILIESGVPVLYALDIIERLIGNKICEQSIVEIKKNVGEGKTISEEMAKTDFFPSMAVQMIAVGEETGEMAKMLNHVAEYYQRVLAVATKRFTTTFEPVMLIFMACTIGMIVMAMFLPIINISKMATQGGG
ncbi:MAG: type II secretion system F family protein [Candidatus Omnitrophica bacterium]|nr:type II secretion system F family protein [Candidatus Omnitrophota bacterium]